MKHAAEDGFLVQHVLLGYSRSGPARICVDRNEGFISSLTFHLERALPFLTSASWFPQKVNAAPSDGSVAAEGTLTT